MKEAAGEANMTVITIVLIGVVAAAGVLLVPKILNGSAKKAACGELGGNLSGDVCKFKDFSGSVEGKMKQCTLAKDANGTWNCGTITDAS